jgi:hypothetical protein
MRGQTMLRAFITQICFVLSYVGCCTFAFGLSDHIREGGHWWRIAIGATIMPVSILFFRPDALGWVLLDRRKKRDM